MWYESPNSQKGKETLDAKEAVFQGVTSYEK